MTDRDAGYREGIEAMREACAKIAERDTRSSLAKEHHYQPDWHLHGLSIAAEIRALPLPSTPDDGKAEAVCGDEIYALVNYLERLPKQQIQIGHPNRGDAKMRDVVKPDYLLIEHRDLIVKLLTHPFPASDGAIRPSALEALRSYEQADADGVMVLVSRQALDEAINALSAHAGDAAKSGGVTCHCFDDASKKFCMDKNRCSPMAEAQLSSPIGTADEYLNGIMGRSGTPDTHVEVKG